MRDGYELVDVLQVCNSKYGKHTLVSFNNESAPLLGAGAIYISTTESAGRSEVMLGANCQINAMWSSPEGDLWSVDDLGDVFTTARDIHFHKPIHKDITLNSSNDAQWATGRVFGGQLNGIWGTSNMDVWATSFSGTVLHWNGTDWIEYQFPKAPTAIHGTANNDIYIVGYEGNIHHWNGSDWNKIGLPSLIRANEPFTDVLAVSKDKIFITGRGGVLLVGNASEGFSNISTSEYTWYGVNSINDRILLAGGPKGIYELKDNTLICLKDKGHPVAVNKTDNALCFIPAEQKDNPWFVRYAPDEEREWTKVNT